MAEPGRFRQAKIIVCCDGTSNSEYIENNPPTNVSRIARCIPPEDNIGRRQVVYYHPGIGTDVGNPRNSWNQGVGNGLDQVIIEAYSFICHNYNADALDQIILIGFSRGAFAVRCIADLIGTKDTQLSSRHRLRVEDPIGFNPMGLLYFAMGSRYRIPQTEFWNERGIYQVPPGFYNSREKAHPTARFLTKANLVKLCPSFVGAGLNQLNGGWHWELLPRAESWSQWIKRFLRREQAPAQQPANILHEAQFGEFERNLLTAWVINEWAELDTGDYGPGGSHPGAILVQLFEWLEDHMANPIPLNPAQPTP
ncbi:hypothetical protein Neosp_004437 [[Neocosmospora] mangrovei]